MSGCGGHMCEPPWPAESVGLTWTCPDCGMEHRSMLVADMNHDGRIRVPVKHIIPGSIGWFGTRAPMTPHAAHLAAQRPTPAPTEES